MLNPKYLSYPCPPLLVIKKNSRIYLPSDPFWDVLGEGKRECKNLLTHPFWIYGSLTYQELLFRHNNISEPQVFKMVLHKMYKNPTIPNKLLYIGEYLFGNILKYMDYQDIVNGVAFCSKFIFLVVQAHFHSLYIRTFRQYPIPKLEFITTVLDKFENIDESSTFTQIHNEFSFYIRNGILDGVIHIIQKALNLCKKVMENNTRDNFEYEKLFIQEFLCKPIVIGGRHVKPIILACEGNYTEIVSSLVKEGVRISEKDIGREGMNCLELAIRRTNPSIMETIIDSTKSISIFEGQHSKIGLFIQAVYTNHLATLHSLFMMYLYLDIEILRNELREALHLATSRGYNHLVQELLTHGNIGYDNDKTPLMLCAKYNNTEIFYLLINIPYVNVNTHNSVGKSALYYAVKYSRLDFVNKLIDLKAKWNILTTKRKTMLHLLTKAENLTINLLTIQNSPFPAFTKMNINGITPNNIIKNIHSSELTAAFEERHQELDSLHRMRKTIKKNAAEGTQMPIELMKIQLKLTKKLGVCAPKYKYEILQNVKPPKRRHSAHSDSGLKLDTIDAIPGAIHPKSTIDPVLKEIYVPKKLNPSFIQAEVAAELSQGILYCTEQAFRETKSNTAICVN